MPLPDRADIVRMLATYGDRDPQAVAEEIDSLELAWLISQVEQRYAVTLDLDDDELAHMATVSGAVSTLRDVMSGSVG